MVFTFQKLLGPLLLSERTTKQKMNYSYSLIQLTIPHVKCVFTGAKIISWSNWGINKIIKMCLVHNRTYNTYNKRRSTMIYLILHSVTFQGFSTHWVMECGLSHPQMTGIGPTESSCQDWDTLSKAEGWKGKPCRLPLAFLCSSLHHWEGEHSAGNMREKEGRQHVHTVCC